MATIPTIVIYIPVETSRPARPQVRVELKVVCLALIHDASPSPLASNYSRKMKS
jgi:hypothetical protein